ncbi:M14 family zinc carboxypeptidase [Sphingomonas sp. BGYR3]|uniref:M14 family zinc carboxypeptidase n=1 Tax=Sphingomonas sp. BGYR3 TaxID=2975483 RepID=UPI0021A9628B|nr:M14 family zinc carboxypeptidase [Sphingomonas sp. BGYR3]MDG5487654.1 M14 family zinc carboxypeptidase [Sphingomonas sp. BGYR3]
MAVLLVAGGAAPVAAEGLIKAEYDSAVPTLETVVGHATGARITRPEDLVRYLEALAAATPDRTRLVTYARSWEGRPLVYLVIGSAANIARLDAIKADTARLAEGRALAPAERAAILARTPAVAWYGAGIHGNEITPPESALALAHHLLAARGDALVDRILAETVVIIDPSQNPDGRARFVNNFESAMGLEAQGDRYTAEHDEPWPGGRTNHYLFDMNRDWFAATQPETRGRLAAFREWNPAVFVDSHEMSGDDSYYFGPPADPVNPLITPRQNQAQIEFGKGRGAWFDRYGIPYFTREVYDAFYPGYGDMWPTLNGSIASTFEQGSPRGLTFTRRNGDTLTYRDGTFNNFIAALSTLETLANGRERILSDYADFRRSAVVEGERASDRYVVIDRSVRRGQAERLAATLAGQGIAVRRMAPGTLCGRSYPDGALIIDKAQPNGRLIRALLDPDVALPQKFMAEQERRRKAGLPHMLYDVTAWTLPLMEGITAGRCGTIGGASLSPVAADGPPPAKAEIGEGFGYAVPWSDAGQARFVIAALRDGLTGSVTDEPFVVQGRRYGKGTVVFPVKGNPADLPQRLATLAQQHGAEVATLTSSWVDEGPNFGSDAFARLKLPKIAMAWDEGTDGGEAGAARYVLERKLGLAVAPIRVRTLGGARLTDYDVLLLPETTGRFGGALGGRGAAAIKAFVEQGGVVVALGSATEALAGDSLKLLATTAEQAFQPEDKEKPADPKAGTRIAGDDAYQRMIADPKASPDEVPGTLVRVDADPDHWLASGYADTGATALVTGAAIYKPLNAANGVNVFRFKPADTLVASGYLWEENRLQLAYKPFLMSEARGQGLVVAFSQSPVTRGYLGGLDLLVANAVLLAPARVEAGTAR